ncbi:MAG: SRPBCC family protein [Mycobacterium sp.]
MAKPLVVEQSRAIPVAPEEAFTKTLPMPLPTLFRRWCGPIPPIKEVRDQTGDWHTAGQTRTIALAGGGTMRETLTSVDAPKSFGYTITGITGPMAPLIDHIEGAWIFAPHGTGTRVTWRWTLHRKSALTAPALPVFARLWRGYARQSLESLSGYLLG